MSDSDTSCLRFGRRRAVSGLPPVRPAHRMRARVVASLAAVALAAGLTFLVVRYASRQPDKVNLGQRVFSVARAGRLAPEVARDGPLLFKDPLNRNRELYLQHLGDDPKQGWVALEGYAPGAPREVRCVLRWEQATRQFRDPCGGGTYPADGAGLVGFPTTVDDDGIVVVDLSSPRP